MTDFTLMAYLNISTMHCVNNKLHKP